MCMTNRRPQQDNNGGPPQPEEEDYDGMLELSLAPPAPPSIRRTKRRTYRPTGQNSRPRRFKSEWIQPQFEWATDRPARVHTLNHLISKQIFVITGEVQCKRCEHRYEMEFNLRQKFEEVGGFLSANKAGMRERAPEVWMNPVLPTCRNCRQENSAKPVILGSINENSAKPVISGSINWLFLLLGQMVGCCTLDQLKDFCKHTHNHSTGAKNRLVYLTYLTLCRQLDPTGPYYR